MMKTRSTFGIHRPAVVVVCAILAALLSNPGCADDSASQDSTLERGRYLAETVALCAHCHAALNDEIDGRPPIQSNYAGIDCPIWEKNKNPRGKDSQDFVTSKLCEPNITPDPVTGIGGWSKVEIIQAFRDGLRPNGAPLHPNMWLNLHAVSDEDAEAIASYIQALPPVVHEQPGRGPVLSKRIHDAALASLPPSPARSPDPSDEAAYGKYLTDIGRCRYCHTPNDAPGREIKGKAFTGGARYWVGGRYNPDARIVVTPNLTTHPEGIGVLSRADFIALFRQRGSGRAVPLARNTVMPWVAFAGMTDQDLGAIWTFLQTLPPQPTSQPTDYNF
jgi:cytochrome c553